MPVAAPAPPGVAAAGRVALPPAAVRLKRCLALGVAGFPSLALLAVFLVLRCAKRGALIEKLPAQPVKVGAGSLVDLDLLPARRVADFPRQVAPLGLVTGGKGLAICPCGLSGQARSEKRCPRGSGGFPSRARGH